MIVLSSEDFAMEVSCEVINSLWSKENKRFTSSSADLIPSMFI